ncbi:cytochrome c nitrite reductase small subunit [Bacteroides sp. 519]|uniref:cytochrome c nitrite reductase small subunit n=1 Tax=Bacteroides sp. 519 TaxID=2302937 RepID=UPI0013D273C4|nr:cytochrome c nitrite reductase small subunit [Bacteroides sp. 519]NDV60724.1 cytochrome c nitrite reductase small subunit [Bacteroides sp. 519]
MKIRNLINTILPSRKWKIFAIIISGIIVGGGGLFLYMLRAHTYLGDDPAACVNCHIMAPYYATWFHSSHSRDATCNDCHVPQDNVVKKWTFKGMDGIGHVAAFLTHGERDVIQAHDRSSQVIMNNCIRCHTQLNTEFVKTGQIDFMMAQTGQGKACWDCHRDVPHGTGNSLSTTPNALVPYPESPVPEWIQKLNSKK